ncbi:MAG: Stp1/IreP family PP2C-type Ser/Thr phosphatase [Acidimicrobiia bacterium]|nr:Stp1/IreP family PP2C-type Ser/Thr phosphatase [Acidimicrobiia bacterium]
MIRFAVGAASDVGRRRTVNEDCAFVSERVVAVADGMGGHEGGEVASEVAIDVLRSAIVDQGIDSLAEAVAHANVAVWERSGEEGLRGMGTTMCVLAVVGPDADGRTSLALSNVGDSRVYVVADAELERLTEDHSLVEGLVREGRITSEEAAVHPQRNIVTRVLGIAETVEIDSWELEPRPGDRYLLCSDGLFNEVDESRIAATLRRLADPQEAAHELVSLANQGGGRDNITVVVADVVDDDGSVAGGFGDRVVRPRRDQVVDLAGFSSVIADRGHSAVDGDGAAAAAEEDDERSMLPRVAAAPREKGTGWFTWRSILFVLLVIAVFATAAGAVAWYAQNGYFVATDDDGEIAVFQGRPGGLLWFEPKFVESTGVELSELTPVLRDRIEAEPTFASFDEAEAYLANMAEQLERSGGSEPATTTTSTSSSITSTSTTSTSTTTAPSVP